MTDKDPQRMTRARNALESALPRVRAASILFLQVPPGRVSRADEPEDLAKDPRVVGSSLYVGPGDEVGELRNSWSRAGHILTSGADGSEAWLSAQEFAAWIAIETEPTGEEEQV